MSTTRIRRRRSGTVRRYNIRTASRSGPLTGISLAKRRRWYADGDSDEDAKQPGAEDADDTETPDETQTDDAEDDGPTNVSDLPAWAQKLLAETRSEAAANRTKLREIESAAEEAKRQEAEEQGKFKELYEQAKVDREEYDRLLEEKAQRLEQVKARNEERLKGLPKEARAIAESVIENAGTEDPDKVAAIIDTLLPTLNPENPAPPKNGGKKGDNRDVSGSGKIELNKVSY